MKRMQGINPEVFQEQYCAAKAFNAEMNRYLVEFSVYRYQDASFELTSDDLNIIRIFSTYLFNNLVSDLGQITIGMINSKFPRHYRSSYKGRSSQHAIRKALRDFFTFLYGKYGITTRNLDLIRASWDSREKALAMHS